MKTFTDTTHRRTGRMAAAAAVAALLLAACLPSAAVAQSKPKSKTTTEWGFKAGLAYPFFKSDLPKDAATMRMGMDYAAGLHMAIVFKQHFAIQPEMLYSYSVVRMTDAEDGFKTKVKCNKLRVPVLFSLRFSAFRLHFGPVFSIMDNPVYLDRNNERTLFGGITPTISYTAGIGVCIAKRVLLDVRYSGRFNRVTNCWTPDADHSIEFKTAIQEVGMTVGYLF